MSFIKIIQNNNGRPLYINTYQIMAVESQGPRGYDLLIGTGTRVSARGGEDALNLEKHLLEHDEWEAKRKSIELANKLRATPSETGTSSQSDTRPETAGADDGSDKPTEAPVDRVQEPVSSTTPVKPKPRKQTAKKVS